MKKKLLPILSIIFIVLICSISFYGCGEKKSVKVSFNANGGTFITGETIKEIETEKSTIISQIDIEVERLGYTFLGWDYDFTTPVSNDIEIKAKWQAKTDTPYKVEYYLQNIDNDNYTLNLKACENLIGITDAVVSANIKDFDNFIHVKSQTDTGRINADGSTVLMVYYDRTKHNVSVDSGEGGVILGAGEYRYGKTVKLIASAQNGFNFLGWFDGGVEVSKDLEYQLTIQSNVSLTAKWQAREYSILYKGLENAIELEGENPKKYNVNSDNFSLYSPVKFGYNFLGWTGDGITTPTKNLLIEKGSFGNKEFTANWQAKTYNITLEANGGEVSNTSFLVSYNGVISGIPSATNGNGTFMGWLYNGKKVIEGETVWQEDYDATFYAMWKAEEYTVKFNLYYEDVGYRVGGKIDGNSVITLSKTISYGETLSAEDFPSTSNLVMDEDVSGEFEFNDWVYRMGIVDTDITVNTVFNELTFAKGAVVEITARYRPVWSN